jgi:hypothetical protein
MRTVVLGSLVVAGLVITAAAVTANPNEGFPQRAIPNGSSGTDGQLIALSTSVGDKYQQVTVIDPKTQAMSVYHIDLADGKIRLRSVRNFHWDLQMVHLNGVTPLPREIQLLLEQQP